MANINVVTPLTDAAVSVINETGDNQQPINSGINIVSDNSAFKVARPTTVKPVSTTSDNSPKVQRQSKSENEKRKEEGVKRKGKSVDKKGNTNKRDNDSHSNKRDDRKRSKKRDPSDSKFGGFRNEDIDPFSMDPTLASEFAKTIKPSSPKKSLGISNQFNASLPSLSPKEKSSKSNNSKKTKKVKKTDENPFESDSSGSIESDDSTADFKSNTRTNGSPKKRGNRRNNRKHRSSSESSSSSELSETTESDESSDSNELDDDDDDDEIPTEVPLGSNVPNKHPLKPTQKSVEDEMVEKMRLVEDINEASRMGFIPPQAPSYSMPLPMLKQIRGFQDEMAMQAMNVGLMGVGLVNIVGILEMVNERYDPLAKVMQTGLKLQGARNAIENNLDKYQVPFTKIYRRMREKGLNAEIPPWLQIIITTVSVLGNVHKDNVMKEMTEEAKIEQNNPEVWRRAEEIARKVSSQVKSDSNPMDSKIGLDSSFKYNDAEMEKKLTEEFSGFDALPSFKPSGSDNIRSRESSISNSTRTTNPTPNPNIELHETPKNDVSQNIHETNDDTSKTIMSTVIDLRRDPTPPPPSETVNLESQDIVFPELPKRRSRSSSRKRRSTIMITDNDD
jgi:hypothetical protein